MAKVHRTELPYDPTPRAIAQNHELAFDALGVWVWARSLPDGAELSVEEVIRQRRGLGADRAARAVQACRAANLWHTLTFREGRYVTSRVVVPPEPWTREQAAASLGLAVDQLVDGPSDRRPLRSVPAGGADTRVSDAQRTDAQPTERQRSEGQPSGGHSLEPREENYPPSPPLRGGNHDCPEGHLRPSRGCCTDRARRERAAEAVRARRDAAEREATAAVLADNAAADPERNRRGLEAAKAALAQMRRQGSVPDGGLGKVLGGSP